MRFHWAELYEEWRTWAMGERRAGKLVVAPRLEAMLAAAKAAAPAVFAGNNAHEPFRQAKMEHLAPWLALAMAGIKPKQRQWLLEALLERLELALREAGVGDVGVGKEVRAMAAALNGRVQRYAPLLAQGDWLGLEAALAEHGVDLPVALALRTAAQREMADLEL